MNKILAAVVLAFGCGGKAAPAPASNSAGATPAERPLVTAEPGTAFVCISNTDSDNCAFGGPLEFTTATKVPGEGRSETCIGSPGKPHNCAYEREPLSEPHDPNKTIGGGAGTGAGSATP